MLNLSEKSNKWLRKSIKLHKRVIDVFQYKYFVDDIGDDNFEEFRQDVLYRLIDEQKKMELELDSRRGRL